MKFIIGSTPAFPVGTTVKAYSSSNWSQSQLPREGKPVGAATAEAVVAADGSLAFSGLAASTKYQAVAEVGGVWKYLRFQTDAGAGTGASVATTPAESVTAKNASTAVVAANSDRRLLIITNDGGNTVYLCLGKPAVAGKGPRLNKEGGFLVITGDEYDGEVTCITKEGESNVSFSES